MSEVVIVDPVMHLREGAALLLNVSGGKDSDAMSAHLLDMRKREGWTGPVLMVHADLGRAEWHSTPRYVRELAARNECELVVVQRKAGDLIARIWQRYHDDPSRPCWPSSAARYCTSDLKRGPISSLINQRFPTGTVICAQGIRAQESKKRAKKPTVSLRPGCNPKTIARTVIDWLPIHKWSEADVWSEIGAHGGIHHEAYKHGNRRLSCALCVLACDNDLINGALHNPDTYREYCRIEAVTGWSFRDGFWISDLRPALLPAETISAVAGHKARLVEGKPNQLNLL